MLPSSRSFQLHFLLHLSHYDVSFGQSDVNERWTGLIDTNDRKRADSTRIMIVQQHDTLDNQKITTFLGCTDVILIIQLCKLKLYSGSVPGQFLRI